MSTRSDATYDDATTTEDFSTDTTPASDTPATGSGATPASDAPATDSLTPNGGTSWTDQCKRQFSTTSTTRCRNLNDDANEAMHDGV